MKPRLLDISRLVSRMGNGPLTGIDRVELAYFREFLKRPKSACFLCRLPRSYAILNAEQASVIFNEINIVTAQPSRHVRRSSRLGTKLRNIQKFRKIARLSFAICKETSLSGCLKKHFRTGLRYFNVGHSNQRRAVFEAVKALANSEIIVLIHDIIPITYPEYSRPEVTRRFKINLESVFAYTDTIIYNSQATKEAAGEFFQRCGRIPNSIVAHLAADSPSGQTYENSTINPSFVTIGTIEPRKNHGLLLDTWRSLAQELPEDRMPDLHVIGRRGWNNDIIFKALDGMANAESHVYEHNDMSDAEAQTMLAQSWALLFPSFVEGFGLPLVEAAHLGVPIICGENDVYREILGDYPLYLNVDNSYLWKQGILERAGRKRESEVERQVRSRSVKLTDWNGHFDRIFRFI